jgi:hypothetical protein
MPQPSFKALYDRYWELDAERIYLEAVLTTTPAPKLLATSKDLARVRREQDELSVAIQAKRQSPNALQWAEIDEKLSDLNKVVEALNNRLYELEGGTPPEEPSAPKHEYTVERVSSDDSP